MAELTPTTVDKRDAFELVLISLLALFLELAIIRWLSTEVRIFAYFKNFALMASFLGIRHRLSSPPAFRTDVLHMVP